MEVDLWTCESCGAEFVPDPECMVEAYFSLDTEDPDSPFQKDMSEEAKLEVAQDIGVTVEQIDRALKGAVVESGVRCICRACQDEDEEEIS